MREAARSHVLDASHTLPGEGGGLPVQTSWYRVVGVRGSRQ